MRPSQWREQRARRKERLLKEGLWDEFLRERALIAKERGISLSAAEAYMDREKYGLVDMKRRPKDEKSVVEMIEGEKGVEEDGVGGRDNDADKGISTEDKEEAIRDGEKDKGVRKKKVSGGAGVVSGAEGIRHAAKSTDFIGEDGREKRCSVRMAYEWVASTIYLGDIEPKDAPSAFAWSLRHYARRGPEAETEFWRACSKLLPSRAELEREEDTEYSDEVIMKELEKKLEDLSKKAKGGE